MKTATVFLLLAFGGAASVTAGDKPKERAKEEMKFGVNAAKRGYWLEALERFERADQLVPNRPHILNNIAVALEASGSFEEAMLAYQTAVEMSPNDRVVQRNFAQYKEFYTTYIAPPPPVVEEEEPEKEGEEGEGETEDEAGGRE
jgi:tetratricopeptide (TPR) repeat protein